MLGLFSVGDQSDEAKEAVKGVLQLKTQANQLKFELNLKQTEFKLLRSKLNLTGGTLQPLTASWGQILIAICTTAIQTRLGDDDDKENSAKVKPEQATLTLQTPSKASIAATPSSKPLTTSTNASRLRSGAPTEPSTSLNV